MSTVFWVGVAFVGGIIVYLMLVFLEIMTGYYPEEF